MHILSRRRSNKPSWWLTFVQVRINENEKKSAICIFFFLIICISLFFSYFLLPVTNSPTFFISWFCFDCLWFSFVLHIILARRWRSITSKAGGLSGFHLSGIRWVPSTQQIHRKKRKKENKNKKKRNKTEKHFLISLRRVSTISVPNMIDCCDRMSGILETHKSGPAAG